VKLTSRGARLGEQLVQTLHVLEELGLAEPLPSNGSAGTQLPQNTSKDRKPLEEG